MNKLLLAFAFLFTCSTADAQTVHKRCGFDYVKAAAIRRNPDFEAQLDAYQSKNKLAKAVKAGSEVTIPVVFHIVLDSEQLNKIGNETGIIGRINSQMQVLNADYNRGNADSNLIPDAFKPLYGDPHIHFGLAHTDPNGNATPGWDLVQTTVTGFEEHNDDPTGDAKRKADGGADAWDINRYVNIWVINFLEDGQTSGIIGLTIPPSFTIDTITGYPKNEMGICINYNAFGSRTSASEYFYPGIDRGRTLTHEMGHYFGLFHTWGDDNGLCPGDIGGKDDGIADTPPQASETYGCPAFPDYDGCSVSGTNGIMFMNYMDYTDDACMSLFTTDQAGVMSSTVTPGGESYGLTLNSALLSYPDSAQTGNTNGFVIAPNPAINKTTYVLFNTPPQNFTSITVVNAVGQRVISINTSNQQSTHFPLEMSGMGAGIYFVQLQFGSHREIGKILLP